MTNLEKYKNAFVEGLEIPVEEVENATMESVDKWDSIGQMSLVARRGNGIYFLCSRSRYTEES